MRQTVRLAVLVLGATGAAADAAHYGSMRNGSLNAVRQRKPSDTSVVNARKAGWTLPDDLRWPDHWEPNPATPKAVLRFLPTGGMNGRAAVSLDRHGHMSSYFGPPEPGRSYVATVRVKGKGAFWFSLYCYSKDAFIRTAAIVTRKLDTDQWREYQGLFANDDSRITSINPALSGTGNVIIDSVTLRPAEPVEVEMVREAVSLYGSGAIIEDLSVRAVNRDKAFAARLSELRGADKVFERRKAGIGPALYKSVKQKIARLRPYVEPKGSTHIQARPYNDMIMLTRVLARLARQKVGKPRKVGATRAIPPSVAHQLPGERASRPATVTIVDVRSNKVRYDENEKATTTVTLVNKAGSRQTGSLVARMRLDLNTVRPIQRVAFTVEARRTAKWSFSYNVGPETYGRAIQIMFVGRDGRTIDRWEEYYAVAAEYFRVHQHSYAGQNKLYKIDPWTTYYNQRHYFAGEPTDFGVYTPDADTYKSGQAGYRVNRRGRRAEIDHFTRMGVTCSCYQTFAFCGQQGYEVMRRHPEHVLYDETGQFSVDPVYGGYPNPMEIGSPLEVGPKRQARSPLDREYTPWQHSVANFAVAEAVAFQSECIRRYASENGFRGIYIDGTMGVWKGFDHQGRPNVSSGTDQAFARLNARNHRVFSKIVKKDNPDFGTWYNWGRKAFAHYRGRGLTMYNGSGVTEHGDTGDEAIRAATDWRNVMILYETSCFRFPPATFLENLIEQRDFAVQKYGANSIVGYNWFHVPDEKPGPSKWAWPTVNYLGAILIATQTHHAGGFKPSFRPTLQFQTCYSRLIWARDIKAVPAEQAGKTITVRSPERIWWKRLVYKRKTKDGHDLIVHLVRIPPTKDWDIHWVDEPAPLEGVKVTVAVGADKVTSVRACRPYQFEEPQQVVEAVLDATVRRRLVTVTIPSFRYHTMAVFHVRSR
jgi:hypothetical protein